ncbi:thiamine-phosphate kinase [Flavobacteriaceae bacterium]|nr:thiamine-phosphate kinase [Flavobacteriaceae bacterium]
MFEEKKTATTSIASLGEFGLIEKIKANFGIQDPTSIKGIGDDAAVIDHADKTVVSTDFLVEGVHFDLSYMPLKHLGYKAVMVNLSDIFAMNAMPTQITVSIAISNRFPVEAVEELYAGIGHACSRYKVDLVGGDTTTSQKGLIISVTAIGTAKEEKITYRSGAKEHDLIVVSGDLGGAYAGLQVLEREKAVFEVNPQSQPDLSTYAYSIERQLKPESRKDIVELLDELNIVPTSMIDISDGLSSELLHLVKASDVGCQIYEDKIPIDPEVLGICKEFSINNTTAALNGGEDYELLFTVDQNHFEAIKNHPLLSVIGHITEKATGCNLVTGLGQQIELTAQGWTSPKEEEN